MAKAPWVLLFWEITILLHFRLHDW
jgi:hypothetical protein